MPEEFLTFRELGVHDIFCRIDGILDREKPGGLYRKEGNGSISRLTFMRRDPPDCWNGDGDTPFKVSWMTYFSHGILPGTLVIKLDIGRIYDNVAHPNQ